ncbi:hypothetical protein JK358_35945 [Nocardia sp. 2]|uniref:EF-hand domain-containing protein n=1 Tax=Nocardia acididurans TaxID=2802282 RepID=A0ABS1MJF8_9NOCA|nr:hypothetical protein [Nocardia acididurans]MBL1079809.1 hypothetical protein [Nocardia acididurans]
MPEAGWLMVQNRDQLASIGSGVRDVDGDGQMSVAEDEFDAVSRAVVAKLDVYATGGWAAVAFVVIEEPGHHLPNGVPRVVGQLGFPSLKSPGGRSCSVVRAVWARGVWFDNLDDT